MNYDYTASKAYCEHLGLLWVDALVYRPDQEAYLLGFTQQQMEAAVKNHLWQTYILFNPKSYNWKQRVILSFHFLFGKMKRVS